GPTAGGCGWSFGVGATAIRRTCGVGSVGMAGKNWWCAGRASTTAITWPRSISAARTERTTRAGRPRWWRARRRTIAGEGTELQGLAAPVRTATERPARILEFRAAQASGGGPEKTILRGTACADRRRFAITVCYLREVRDPAFDLDRRAAE